MTTQVDNERVTGNQYGGLYISGCRCHRSRRYRHPERHQESRSSRTTPRISNNVVTANETGIDADGTGLTITGNAVHDNDDTGISAGSGLISGNTVYNQTSGTGISLSGGEARGNTVYGNASGIFASGSGLVDGNRVFNNTERRESPPSTMWWSRGTRPTPTRRGSSPRGVLTYYYNDPFVGSVVNNLVYDNQAAGITVYDTTTAARVVNNTVYTPVGDALHLEYGSGSAVIRNNILAVDAGYDIEVDADAGTIRNSDDNLFSPGIAGSVGFLNAPLRSFAAWQAASGQDTHSVSGEARMFRVNPAGNGTSTPGFDTAGGGHDGGADDNFYLRAYSSPAATGGDPSCSPPATDIEGFSRSPAVRGQHGLHRRSPVPRQRRRAAARPRPPSSRPRRPSLRHRRAADGRPGSTRSRMTFQRGRSIRSTPAIRSPTSSPALHAAEPGLPAQSRPYVPGSRREVLDIVLPAGVDALPPDTYQLTVFSQFTTNIHDLEGTPLRGESTSAGYQTTFMVLPLITVTPSTGLSTSDAGGKASFPAFSSSSISSRPATSRSTLHIVNGPDGGGPTVPCRPRERDLHAPELEPERRRSTVTGVDDHIDEGNTAIAYTVATDPAQSSDPAFSGLNPADVTITAVNNDVAGVTPVTAALPTSRSPRPAVPPRSPS